MRRNVLRPTKKHPDSRSGCFFQRYQTKRKLEHVVRFHTHDPVTTRGGFVETRICIVDTN